MDLKRKEDSNQRRKEKKKKHHRSRSGDDHKKKKQRSRDRQTQHKKKDKKQRRQKSQSRPDKHEKKEKSKERSREKDKKQQKDREKKEKEKEPQPVKIRQKSKQRSREREKQKTKQKYRQRSREKKKDDKHRSKSKKKRSHEKAKRDKSRQYEKWRRQRDNKFRFDSPPKSDDSYESQDQQKIDKLNKMKAQKELVTSKADRKLYLGNLPPNITSNQLMTMLNAALKKMQINTDDDGDSIVSAWISPDGVGHYAFVQFRTAQQATAGLALNGASLYGYQLKLGRPKQYIEYHKQLLSEFGSDGNIDTILRKVQAMGGYGELKIEERLVCPPSKIIVLKYIVTIEELAIDEEYKEIYEDVTDMAKRHGDILKILIPRPLEIDLTEVQQRVKGLGLVFIKYKTVEQAKYARKQFIKQMFSERSVACSFFPEKKFEEGDLDIVEKITIDF